MGAFPYPSYFPEFYRNVSTVFYPQDNGFPPFGIELERIPMGISSQLLVQPNLSVLVPVLEFSERKFRSHDIPCAILKTPDDIAVFLIGITCGIRQRGNGFANFYGIPERIFCLDPSDFILGPEHGNELGKESLIHVGYGLGKRSSIIRSFYETTSDKFAEKLVLVVEKITMHPTSPISQSGFP